MTTGSSFLATRTGPWSSKVFAVIYATAIPEHLRGYTSRFLSQVGANLFVGNLTPKVADSLWEKLSEYALETSSLVMIRSDIGEAGYVTVTHGSSSYEPIEFDGIQLPSYLSPEPIDEFEVAENREAD
jgi:CRISPR-associated protein Cas2